MPPPKLTTSLTLTHLSPAATHPPLLRSNPLNVLRRCLNLPRADASISLVSMPQSPQFGRSPSFFYSPLLPLPNRECSHLKLSSRISDRFSFSGYTVSGGSDLVRRFGDAGGVGSSVFLKLVVVAAAASNGDRDAPGGRGHRCTARRRGRA